MKRAHVLFAIPSFVLLSLAAAGCEGDSPNGDFSFTGFDGGGLNLPDGGNGPIDTLLTRTPDPVTKQTEATFEFTATRVGRFGCRVDDQPPAECTSPFTTTVKEGPHTFEVAAATADGAVDSTPATFTWTVDTTPPKTSITQAPPAFDNSTNVTFVFTANEKATFRCSVEGGPLAPCTSPLSLSSLAAGQHSFSVAATDGAGNEENPPLTHTWTIDTSLPDTTIDSGPTGSVKTTSNVFTFSSPVKDATFECAVDSGAFAPCTSPHTVTTPVDGPHKLRVRARGAGGNLDPTPAERTWTVDTVAPTISINGGPNGPTKAKTPSFPFVAGGGATKVECRVDTDTFAACLSPFTTRALPDGAHTVEVRASDDAGNAASATRSFSVDTTVPTVTITGGPSGPTNDTTPTFTFTAEAGSTTTCRVDTGAFAACASPFTTAALPVGNHTFEVEAKDAAGNVATANRTFTVDLTGPVITILNGPNGKTNLKTGSFTFSANEPATTECRIGGAFAACTSPYGYGPLADATYTFEVRGKDLAGNPGAAASRAFTVDTVPPTVTFGGQSTTSVNTGGNAVFFFSTENGATTTCRIYAQGNPSGAYAPCTSGATVIAPALSGAWIFEVRATDAAGNPGIGQWTFYTYILT